MPVFQGTDSTPEEGEAGALAILTSAAPGPGSARPTALLCLSDRLAEGALRAARSLGLRVPEDLSVVGFDDAVPTAAALGLTTVRQPNRGKGEQAAHALLGLLDGTGPTGPRPPLPTEFVVRGSTGPA
jgi:DNA-binding LacI/PurR family transcriptional regulator